MDGRTDASDACGRILASLTMYGPHDRSQWDGGHVALGRNLYRLLPEDVFDRKPLVGADGTRVLVADLRIDNRDELVGSLSLSAERARLCSDASLLMEAWNAWEEGAFERIVGDYAFALWDSRRQELILARDPLGGRPLHLHHGEGFVAFASMPKGLHALPEVPVRPDEQRVLEFVAMMPDTGPRSFFEGIERVEMATFVAISRDRRRSRRHWQPKREQPRLKSSAEYVEALRAHLDQAVKSRLRGAGSAVASRLSGGWDSSSVAATAAREMERRGGAVVAFTSVPRDGYDGPDPYRKFANEGPLAAKTASMYPNMQHVLVRSDGKMPLDVIDKAHLLYDRLIWNSCVLVLDHQINDAAKDRGLTVMLHGMMGNYTLSYEGLDWLPEMVARRQWGQWFGVARSIVKNSEMRWGGVLAKSLGPWVPGPLWSWLHRLKGDFGWDVTRFTAINPETWNQRREEIMASRASHDFYYRPMKDSFERLLWLIGESDFANFYKGDLAGWGLDYRDPTADRRLVEFCLATPRDQFLVDGRTKVLAERALADRLPAEVLDNRLCGYQFIEWHEALTANRSRMSDELERFAQIPSANVALNIPRLRHLIEDWPTSGWQTDDVIFRYRASLLRGLHAGHFLRKASGTNL